MTFPVPSLEHWPAVPWKNGGGVTRVVAVEPRGADFDTFVWRVSLAEVAHSSRFSHFAGVDRTIALLDGGALVLRAPGGAEYPLAAPFAAVELPGETPVTAELTAGPALLFNVMVRRGVATATTAHWRDETRLPHAVDEAVFYCPRGVFRIYENDGSGCVIPEGGALRLSNLSAGTLLVPQSSDAILLGALFDMHRGAAPEPVPSPAPDAARATASRSGRRAPAPASKPRRKPSR